VLRLESEPEPGSEYEEGEQCSCTGSKSGKSGCGVEWKCQASGEVEAGEEVLCPGAVEIGATRQDLELVDVFYVVRVVDLLGQLSVETAADWAERSIWYEALESAVAQHEANPGSVEARADLEAWVRQANLEIAIP
jgi:hypothetical protein